MSLCSLLCLPVSPWARGDGEECARVDGQSLQEQEEAKALVTCMAKFLSVMLELGYSAEAEMMPHSLLLPGNLSPLAA